MARKVPDATAIVAAVDSIADPSDRGAAATQALAALAEAQQNVKLIRQQAVVDLLDEGWSYEEIAQAIGVNRSRAFQIGKGWSGSTMKQYE